MSRFGIRRRQDRSRSRPGSARRRQDGLHAVRTREQRLCCGSTLPPDRPSLSASIVWRRMGWQTHLGSVDPFAGARRSGKSILRRHLRVWALSILQESWPQRRDLHSIAPDATRSVACCYSGPSSRLHHLGSTATAAFTQAMTATREVGTHRRFATACLCRQSRWMTPSRRVC